MADGDEARNLKVLAKYTRRMVSGDTQAVFDTFAPEFFTHVAERVSPEVIGQDLRPAEVKFWEESARAFPDRAFVVHKVWVVDEGNTVISHYSMTGTHTGGSFFGAPPSGQRVEINGTAILRFENGKVVEHWGGPHCMYGLGLLTVVEPPVRALPAASSGDSVQAASA